MNDLKYFELHKYVKKQYLAKGEKYITFDKNWYIEETAVPVNFALDDFRKCLKRSFGIQIGEKKEKAIKVSLEKNLLNSFRINVCEECVEFSAANVPMLVQAIYYAEDIMKIFGDASLEKKEYTVTPQISQRIATSALEDGLYTDEYLNILLHYGYNGVILYKHDEKSLELIKGYGMKAYLFSDEDVESTLYDGIITEKYEDDPNKIYYTCFWGDKVEQIKKLSSDSTVILSFDSDQEIEKDGVKFKTNPGSLVMAQPSDSFIECYNTAKKCGLNIWILNFSGGRTTEFGSMPYIPAMMQWFIRNEALSDFEFSATVESDRYGFIPSIVGEFAKAQNLSPHDEGGICIQKLAAMHYGAENTEKVMMALKKVTDGVNYLIYNYADYEGPLQFGPAYPLVNSRLYQYDFFNNDITLETDVNLKAADCFNKAAMILSHIKNDEAQILKNLLNFAVNTLVTGANAKRWYRRINVLETTNEDYKKKFLYEQLIKIGEQEIKNAYDTAEILINAPFLQGNNSEALCTADALDAKIKLTEKALEEIRKKINK